MTTYFLLHILYFITIVKLNSHITHSSKILKIGRNSYFLFKKIEEKQEKRIIQTLTVFSMPVIVILPNKQGILYQRPFIFLFIHLIMEYQMVLDSVTRFFGIT